MKFSFYLIFLVIILGCSGNSENENCNFLLDIGVNETINLSLPQYSQLQFISNSVYIPNAGNGGIIVTNTGSGYVAFDAADPNHIPSACSVLSISGAEGICGCADKNKYSLFSGQPLENGALRCGLRNYRVEKNGNILLIFN